MLTYKQYFTDDIQLHLYLHTQFHMHTKGSLLTSIKPNANEGFCMAIMFFFYYTEILWKSSTFFTIYDHISFQDQNMMLPPQKFIFSVSSLTTEN